MVTRADINTFVTTHYNITNFMLIDELESLVGLQHTEITETNSIYDDYDSEDPIVGMFNILYEFEAVGVYNVNIRQHNLYKQYLLSGLTPYEFIKNVEIELSFQKLNFYQETPIQPAIDKLTFPPGVFFGWMNNTTENNFSVLLIDFMILDISTNKNLDIQNFYRLSDLIAEYYAQYSI